METRMKRVHLTGPAQGSELKTRLMADGSTDIQKTLDLMQEISKNIADGATAFLVQEYKYMLVYVVIFSAIIGPCVNVGTMVAFIVGSSDRPRPYHTRSFQINQHRHQRP
mmetsp:Transcript_27586/g.23648  ORF Transcript_27586/g.23648 Transcript_27586/m.23648 type:complete len:110 (-) Transcript_27586:281-610(-)